MSAFATSSAVPPSVSSASWAPSTRPLVQLSEGRRDTRSCRRRSPSRRPGTADRPAVRDGQADPADPVRHRPAVDGGRLRLARGVRRRRLASLAAPFAAEGVSWPPGPRRSCCDDALPPPEPSSVSTYTPAPIRPARRRPPRRLCRSATGRRADGGWTDTRDNRGARDTRRAPSRTPPAERTPWPGAARALGPPGSAGHPGPETARNQKPRAERSPERSPGPSVVRGPGPPVARWRGGRLRRRCPRGGRPRGADPVRPRPAVPPALGGGTVLLLSGVRVPPGRSHLRHGPTV